MVGVPLTQRHRVARLDWARQQTIGLVKDGKESSSLTNPSLTLIWPRVRVWHRRGGQLDTANVVECNGYGGESVMLMGSIAYKGKTKLKIVRGRLNAARYCADIILPTVYLAYTTVMLTFFQQDNHAVICNALYTRNILVANSINKLEWPSRSPDLASI